MYYITTSSAMSLGVAWTHGHTCPVIY